MKKGLLLCSALIAAAIAVNAQWVTQATGFATAQRGIQSIYIVDANIVWAAAYDGLSATNPVQEFTRTINGGTNWTPGSITNAAGLNNSNICAINEDTAWVAMYDGVNGGGKVLRTNDGGVTWTHQTTASYLAPAGFPNVVYFFDENNGVSMGDPNGGYFEFYTTLDGGTTWTRVPQPNIPANLTSPTEYGIVNRYSVRGDTVWYGTNRGRIYRSVDKGYNWTVATTGLTNISDHAFRDQNNGLFYYLSSLVKTTDGGLTWSNVPYTGTVHDGGISAAGNGYVSTGSLGSSYSTDDGTTWTTIDNIQHSTVSFYDGATGWSGGFNIDANNEGIFKWVGINVGMNETKTTLDLMVYPNPNKGLLSVSLNGKEDGKTTVTIYDLMGRTMTAITENNTTGCFIKNMDLSSYPAGVYFVEVKDETQTYIKKIIKQ